MEWLVTDNNGPGVKIADIPVLEYGIFRQELSRLLSDENRHIGHYFAVPLGEELAFFCMVLDDSDGKILLASHRYGYYSDNELESVAADHQQVHPFEREISELYGIRFVHSPWDKPLRFPHNKLSASSAIDNYPFYTLQGESLHEVNVGPIHAGVIEPGAFRFICNGERVLHLEIALGYQHRGVETLMAATPNRLRQAVLAESTAGDTAVGHAAAYVRTMEKFSGRPVEASIELQRAVALELERIAMHIADSGALCMDIGYQTGQVACEALRTIVINTIQKWCGNRFGKGLVRPGGTNFPLDSATAGLIVENLEEVVRRYNEVREDMKHTQSLLARFEDCGTVNRQQMQRIGAVGPAARASGLSRDLRSTHPWGAYRGLDFRPETKQQGDVMARLMLRGREIFRSAELIREWLTRYEPLSGVAKPDYDFRLPADTLAFSFIEGWRGEICHAAITGPGGEIICYKIKDPSVHNWLALALAVRGEGISDFPINNKSFNLSYCGHDL